MNTMANDSEKNPKELSVIDLPHNHIQSCYSLSAQLKGLDSNIGDSCQSEVPTITKAFKINYNIQVKNGTLQNNDSEKS